MRRRHGFTMIEMMVGFGVGALILGTLGWLLFTAFRVNRNAGLEMDFTTEALRVFRRTSRDVMASRGMVRFQPAGAPAPVDGLQLKPGAIVVYELRDGSVWRSVYGPPPHALIAQEALGTDIAYFHIVPLESGIHVALELSRSTSDSPDLHHLELSTVVEPRGW